MAERHMPYRQRALSLTQPRGIVRTRLHGRRHPLVYLRRVTDAGELVASARGHYQDPERARKASPLAKLRALVPNGMVSTNWNFCRQ